MLDVALRHGFGPDQFSLDVAFTAPHAGITVLFGPSGCGKSTILAAIAGLLRPRHGKVTLGGTTLLDTAMHIDLPPERRRLGMVFQEARLFPHLRVETNLRYGARRAPPGPGPNPDPGPGFDEVVALLGIGPLLGRRPRNLSGGERQRVALGRALLARPRLLLMDEPLAALDGARRAELLPFLARLRDVAAIPVLYVTHALDEVDALADRLVLLDAGRILAQDTAEALALRTDLPLSARRDAGTLIACRIAEHACRRGLTRLEFEGGAFWVPLRAEAVGSRARIRLRARDVAGATQPPQGLSTQNILPATVTHIAEAAGGQEGFGALAVGPTALLARLTRDSVDRLALEPGQAVWAVIKAVTFDHARAPET
ncbi:MAG: molybdenum ABC transporter ATP-binding protein [Rubritepida sp.]|nr:molybdenum ABC transporter ATP-binding protein [Rubritepida sp.]